MIVPAVSPLENRAGAGAGRHRGVFPEAAGRFLLRRELPFRAPFSQFRIGDEQVELALRDVQADPVPVPDQGDRPPRGRLGGDMTDGGAARPSGEAPVGDHRHLVAEPLSHDVPVSYTHLTLPTI